jgi:hypothetical protein
LIKIEAMADSAGSGFHIAPFGIDGRPVGVGFYSSSDLSPEWLEFCAEVLRQNAEAFDLTLGGKLSHIRLRFTSASGAAIGTIFVRGAVASSLLLQAGQVPDADREVRGDVRGITSSKPLDKGGTWVCVVLRRGLHDRPAAAHGGRGIPGRCRFGRGA